MSGTGVRSGVRSAVTGRRARAAEVGVMVALLAGPLVPVALPGLAQAGAQSLDLGGVPTGPAIGAKTAAGELASELGVEAQDLIASAQKLSAEAKDAALAKARLRSAAAYLLAAGAEASWSESACAVAGLRLAGALRRADEVIEAAASARSTRIDAPLAGEDAKAAVAAMRALAQAPIDGLRAAAAARADVRAVRVADALAGFLAPLVAIAEIVEGGRIEDCWPVLADARVAAPERADRAVSTDEVRAAIGSVQDADARGALTALLEASMAAGARASFGDDLGAARDAAEAASWIDGRIAAGAPWSATESTLRATSARVAADARALAAAIGARDEGAAAGLRASIAATSSRLDAARLVLAMRAEPSHGELSRKRLDAAAEALVAGAPGATARQMRRAAERIAECCEACATIAGGAAPAAPKDFREVARQIEREAKIAIRGVPAALALLAQDPSTLADPDVSAPIERAMALAADRAKLASMQSWLERVAALRPAAGAGFSAQLRRLARLQLDPIRRGSAQAAIASLELQIAQALPFAYEDELKRGTERARALTDGRAAELADAAGAARIAWADALAKGDFGGAAAQRLDQIARLLACLRDLDSLGAPITRGEGDRLATWGGWAARRAVLAPAAQDLDSRAVLAVRSLLAPPSREAEGAFTRDVEALEKAIPLVRLAARLERSLGPLMRGSPESLLPTLAPLVDVPGEGAFLAPEWPRLLALNRALFEAEFARRSGNIALARSLDGYLAELARDIDRAAFGATPAVTTLPGFDGNEDASGDDRGRRR